MTSEDRRPPAPKRRLGGWALVVLAIVAGAFALAGVPSASTIARGVLAVIGLGLLVLGLTRVRATVPGVESVKAEQAGLLLTVPDGDLVTVPWRDLTAIDLRRVTTVWRTEGHLLRLRFRGAVRRPLALDVYEGESETGMGQLVIGLTPDQESYLRRHLPDLAGESFAARD